MLKTSMWDYEKSNAMTYPFYFINWQSIHRTTCMQRIKKILMWEVLPATALKLVSLNHVNQMRNRSNHKLNCVDDSRPNFNLRTFKREQLISYKMYDSLVAENLNMKNAFDPVL